MMLLKLMTSLFMGVLHCSSVSSQFSFSQPATGPSSVCEGSNVTLQCRVVFNDQPRDSVWSRNGTLVRVNVNEFIPNHNEILNSTTGVFTDLVITNVALEDDNTMYTCTSNDGITSSVVLNVSGPPSIFNVTNDPCLNDIMLSWSVTSDVMACGPVSYTLTISSGGMMRMVNTNDTYYHFTGLTPETDYTISIQPSNSAGSGQSYTETIRTAPDSTPSINSKSVTSEICLNDALLSWNLTSNQMTCSSVSYNLTKYSDGNMTIINTANTFYNFTGLTPGTAYTISIVPLNMVGSGEGCNHTIMTAQHDTLTGVRTEAVKRYATYITIRIIPMNEAFCVGSVNYSTTVEPPHGRVSKVNQTVYNITGLNASTTYTITTTVALRGHEVHKVILNESTPNIVDSQKSDDDTTIIIIVVVVVVCGVGAGGASVGIGMYKKRQITKRTVPSKDQCDNDYAEAKKTDDALQEKDNLHYDYALNGPRGIVFPSSTTGMPQNQ